MSGDKDVSKPREGGRAQRTYASLECALGFHRWSDGTVTIGYMNTTRWRCIHGKAGNKDSLYEKIEEE